MDQATILAAQAYAKGPNTANEVHHSQRIMGELVAECERLQVECRRLQTMNERAIGRIAAAAEVLGQVARREGLKCCPKCQESFDAV